MLVILVSSASVNLISPASVVLVRRITEATAAPSVGATRPEDVASFTDLAEDESSGPEVEDMVEIEIQFMDENGNQKTMVIRVPRDQAQQYIPPDQD